MKKIFLDTNVILDLLLDRAPYSDDVAEIIEQSAHYSIELCVSSITITDTNYIIEKYEGVKTARQKTKVILDLVTVESVAESTVQKASKSKFKDFEDAVQNFCAIESNHNMIVTRDVKGFRGSSLSILTPKEVLAKINSSF